MRLWNFTVKYSTRPKNAGDGSQQLNRSPHFNFQKQRRPQQDVNTYSPYRILNQSPFQLCSLLSHNTACYSDCQSRATIKAFVSISTANISFSCGWPTVLDFQTADVQFGQPTFSCSCTTGGKSTQHFWIIQYLLEEFHFHPLNFNQHHHQCHLPLVKNSQDLPACPASRVSPNKQISLNKSHQSALLRATRIFQEQLFSCCCPKTKKHTVQHLHFPPIHTKKNWVNEWKLPPPQKNFKIVP